MYYEIFKFLRYNIEILCKYIYMLVGIFGVLIIIFNIV